MTMQEIIKALSAYFPHVEEDVDETRVWSDHEGYDQFGVAIGLKGDLTFLDCDGYPSNKTPELSDLLWMVGHHKDLEAVWSVLNR